MTPQLATKYVFSLAIKVGTPIVAGETGSEKYRWLMENLFIGVGARHPDRVEIDVHQVL